jgi:hypothetical protein
MVWIAGSTVGSGGGTISFSSIPQTFTHLQLRIFAQPYFASVTDGPISLRFNSDSGANYTRHAVAGNGTSAFSYGTTGNTGAPIDRFRFAPSGSVFTPAIVDILDYTNTSKNTTVRSIGGYDNNGDGDIRFCSSLWLNTAAIISIAIPETLNQFSRIDLYGITSSQVTGA